MRILEDTNQKSGKHDCVNFYFKKNNIDVIRQRLPVGDYVLENEKISDVFRRKEARGIPVKMMDLLGTYDVCVDEKYSIQELAMDICGKQHERFRDELILAQNNGIKLFILVRNGFEVVYNRNGKYIANKPITSLDELHTWVNPRLWIFQSGKQKYPTATRGITLKKACMTIQQKYGCTFVFCDPKDAGRMIMKILEGRYGEEGAS